MSQTPAKSVEEVRRRPQPMEILENSLMGSHGAFWKAASRPDERDVKRTSYLRARETSGHGPLAEVPCEPEAGIKYQIICTASCREPTSETQFFARICEIGSGNRPHAVRCGSVHLNAGAYSSSVLGVPIEAATRGVAMCTPV
jgi:hypothetical protein